jgi:hypothetical protein
MLTGVRHADDVPIEVEVHDGDDRATSSGVDVHREQRRFPVLRVAQRAAIVPTSVPSRSTSVRPASALASSTAMCVTGDPPLLAS